MRSPDPLRAPVWAPVVMAGALLVGGAGVFVSVLHLGRNSSDRAFSLFSGLVKRGRRARSGAVAEGGLAGG